MSKNQRETSKITQNDQYFKKPGRNVQNYIYKPSKMSKNLVKTVKNNQKTSKMLKNLEKTVKNVKKREKSPKKIEICQK